MAAILQLLLTFSLFLFAAAQTTTIDVPFFNITSQQITAAIRHIESSTTILGFSCDFATSCAYNSTFPYYGLTIAPVLDATTYGIRMENQYVGHRCWILPQDGSSVAVCASYGEADKTYSHISTLPVTITSGAERLASANATTISEDSSTVIPSAITTLTLPLPYFLNTRPIFASIVSTDATISVLTFDGRHAPATWYYDQVLTVGPSTMEYNQHTDGFTLAWGCTMNLQPDGSARCVQSMAGSEANFPGIKITTYAAESIPTVEVTVTEAPLFPQTILQVPFLGGSIQAESVTASIVAADATTTSLKFKLGQGLGNNDDIIVYTEAMMFGQSTLLYEQANDLAGYVGDCRSSSANAEVVCEIRGTGSRIYGYSPETYQETGTEVGTINISISAGAEKLPGYTPTATMGGTGPSASPGSASTGALPSATDSTSSSPDRPTLTNASLAGVLLLMVAVCLS